MSDYPIITELGLPTRLGFEKVAMSTAASVAEWMGFSCDRVEDLKTAVAEACLNAIEHGNRMNHSLRVMVTLAVQRETLEVRIHDHGHGFEPPSVPPDMRRKMLGEENARGLGVFLIQALVDEVEYGRESSGSFARLIIRLRKPNGG
jgi:serine/threonine-protein kinase RsbW